MTEQRRLMSSNRRSRIERGPLLSGTAERTALFHRTIRWASLCSTHATNARFFSHINLARIRGGRLTFVLGAFLLAQPVLDVLWYRLIMRRNHAEYDSHGDLHSDVLDYLEGLEKIKRRDEMLRAARANRLEGIESSPVDQRTPTASP